MSKEHKTGEKGIFKPIKGHSTRKTVDSPSLKESPLKRLKTGNATTARKWGVLHQ